MEAPPTIETPPTSGSDPASAAVSDPASDSGSGPVVEPRRGLTRREHRWVLRRCAKRGHLLARFADPELAETFGATGAIGSLLRCLRCGDFVPAGQLVADRDSSDPTTVIGTAETPA
jgi:hypothetical protein